MFVANFIFLALHRRTNAIYLFFYYPKNLRHSKGYCILYFNVTL